MKDNLVSVIMPVYNGAKYLEKSISSVAAQSVLLELIVVDDCSLDNSLEVIEKCKNYYSSLNLILYKMPKNSGVAACRNMGLSLAKGRYTAYLDCDDWWLPEKLTLQLELINRLPCSLCCTARELADENGCLTGRIIAPPPQISFKDLLKQNSIVLSSVLIKTEIARQFPMGNDNLHEDYLMWLSVLKIHGSACGISLPLVKYRKSQNSKTSSKAKSALMHLNSLKKAGIPPLPALYYFVCYALSGIKNHGGLK